jgi:hypothetical protein
MQRRLAAQHAADALRHIRRSRFRDGDGGRCGVIRTFSIAQKGWPAGRGLCWNTSSVASAMWPDRSAASSASSSSSAPRATLIRFAPRGIRASSAAPIKPRVAGVSGSSITSVWASASAVAKPASPCRQRTPGMDFGVRAQPVTA